MSKSSVQTGARRELSEQILQEGHRGILCSAATGLPEFISGLGGDPESVLASGNIAMRSLEQPTSSISLIDFCKVLENAASTLQFDNFGLTYGKEFYPQKLGLIGYIGLHSPTVEAAIANMVQDFPWHQRDTFIALADCGDCLRLDYQVRHGAILARRQDAELTMMLFLNLIRQAIGPHWSPRELHFEHPRPEQWHEHCKVFDAPVWFDQPRNSMLIPKIGLGRAMAGNDPMLLIVIREAIRRIGAHNSTQEIVQKARSQINLLLGQGEIELQDVADGLGMSSASLQRKLAENGVSFSGLVEQVRKEMAASLLGQKNISVSHISHVLGYSEISAFSRAFKRWFGVSPRQWRKD
jgi:AraC-like DNA-binding protein